MKIILDAMSGDNCPRAAVLGATDAVKHSGMEIILVGREARIMNVLRENGMEALPAGLEIVNSGDGAGKQDSLLDVVLRQKDNAILVGLQLLSEGKGDALVSAVSIDALLEGMPLRKEAYALLKQAREASLVSFGENVLIRSLGETAGFLGGRLKQMLKKNAHTMLWAMRGKAGIGELMQLMNRRDLIRLFRVRKPVMLVRPDADRLAFRDAIAHMAEEEVRMGHPVRQQQGAL